LGFYQKQENNYLIAYKTDNNPTKRRPKFHYTKSKPKDVNKSELENLTEAQLEKKLDSLKLMAGILLGLTVALSFFGIRDFLRTEEYDWFSSIIVLCTFGGFVSVYQEVRQIQKVLRGRKGPS